MKNVMKEIPLQLEPIFDKPGSTWSDEERDLVFAWLTTSVVLGYLKYVASLNLYDVATPDNIEDTVTEYIGLVLPQKNINKYDPAKGKRFPSFMIMYLEYFCLDLAKRIRRQDDKEVPLSPLKKQYDNGIIEIEIVASAGIALEDNQIKKEEIEEIREAIQRLPERERTIIIKFYIDELSTEEMAVELNIKPGHVRVLLYRARQKLRNALGGIL